MENLAEWCRKTGVDYQYAWKRINVEGLSTETVLFCWNNHLFQKWAKANDLPLNQAFSLRDMGLSTDEILVFFKKPVQRKIPKANGKVKFSKWCDEVGLPFRYARNIQTNYGFETREQLLNWFRDSPDWVFHDGKWTYGYKGAPIEEWFTEDECKLIWEHAHWYAISQCPRGRVIRTIEAYKLKPKFHGKVDG